MVFVLTFEASAAEGAKKPTYRRGNYMKIISARFILLALLLIQPFYALAKGGGEHPDYTKGF